MNLEIAFSLFASFIAWGTAANIFRLTQFVGQRSIITMILGLSSMIGVHIAPIYFLGSVYGVGLIVVSYIVTGLINGLMMASYMRNEDWPENFGWQSRYGPVLCYTMSLILLGLILVNHLK